MPKVESDDITMTVLSTLLNMSTFEGYLYAYPHKTAYRNFSPTLDMQQVWQDECTEQLFLYVHIPFCEMRCGFCNLFTMTGAKEDAVSAFINALAREAKAVKHALGAVQFSQIAIGGGTPTFLNVAQLEQLFAAVNILVPKQLPTSIETSPSQATSERLAFLHERGMSRISVGVESFSRDHLRAMGRPAQAEDTPIALDNIRKLTSAALNIDLIYGAQGQTRADFIADIKQALVWQPEEVFIYPLYVGNLTGLSKTKAIQENWDANRLAQYRAGRDMLLASGYHQSSMRRFVRGAPQPKTDYSCQEDGMVGLGAGARSYTGSVHYSSDYAVGRAGIQGIIQAYADEKDFSRIRHGIQLSQREQKIRYVIKSILNADGLDLARYQTRFGSTAQQDIPKLDTLIEAGYLVHTQSHLIPTTLGFERADAMGPFLISTTVKNTMQGFQWV